jgi:hypothetical protein
MNYLTNYYKNLSEQLQERVNQLQVALNEYYAPGMERSKMEQKAKLTLAQSLGQSMNKLKKEEEDSNTQVGNIKKLISTELRKGKAGSPLIKSTQELIRSQESKQTPESMPYSEREEPVTETDDDILAMRQTAADQGGIPQDMVGEPIRRTKQLPDGRLINSESLPKPKMRPNIDGGSIPYPKPSSVLKDKFPNLLDKNKEEYGIIPQTPEQRKKFGMTPFDNRMS